VVIPSSRGELAVHRVRTGSVGTTLEGQERSMQARLTLRIDPVGIEIGQGRLVTDMFHGFGRFLVDDAAGPPTAALLLGVGR
jgi:hypothetical protein